MRPQDVPILLKIISFERASINWKMKDLARELDISHLKSVNPLTDPIMHT
jgi:hypothetical protein